MVARCVNLLRRRIFWISSAFICFSIGAIASHGNGHADAAYTAADPKNFGITLSPGVVASTGLPVLPDGTSGISGSAAVAVALEHTYAASADGVLRSDVSESATFGMLTDDQILEMTAAGEVPKYQNVPCWVITFTGAGVVVASTGPVGSAVAVHNEESVVVDARDGSWLFSYS